MTQSNINRQNFSTDQLPKVLLIDLTAQINQFEIASNLKVSGYNLVGILYDIMDAYIYNTCVDYLIIISNDNCAALVENLLLCNLNFRHSILISNNYSSGIGFNYLPAYMLTDNIGTLNEPLPLKGLVQVIINALKIFNIPHKYLLNLSYQYFSHFCKQLLIGLGFNINHKGTTQLINASYISVFRAKANLYTNTYPYIANMFNCSVEAVERNIRSAINGAVRPHLEASDNLKVFLKKYNLDTKSIQPIIDAIKNKKNKNVIASISQFMWQHIY